MASPSWIEPTSTWPPSTAVSVGDPPSKGTAVAVTPVWANNSACDSWLPVPTPVVP
jgi:hypothetical protein